MDILLPPPQCVFVRCSSCDSLYVQTLELLCETCQKMFSLVTFFWLVFKDNGFLFVYLFFYYI